MQPSEEHSRCISSCDAPPLNFSAKEMDLRRMNRVDPRYAMYRWDCGSYPYYKVPILVNPTSSSSGIPHPGSFLPLPGGVPHPATDPYCSSGGICHQEGHDLFPHPEHCICDPRDPRYLSHHNTNVIHWESIPSGYSCCGQHAMHRALGPGSSSRHPDSARLYAAPVCGISSDGAMAHQNQQESVSENRRTASNRCLPHLPETSTNSQQHLGSIAQAEETASHGHSSYNPKPQNAGTFELKSTSDSVESSRADEEQTKKKALESESFDEVGLQIAGDQSDSVTSMAPSLSSVEDKKEERSPARKVTSASSILQSGLNTGLKVMPKSSQVTPLYGRPSWWGDEPEQEASYQWKYNPMATSSPSSLSPASCSSFPIALNQKQNSDSIVAPLTKTTVETSDDMAPSSQSLSEALHNSCSVGEEVNAETKERKPSVTSIRNGRLSTISGTLDGDAGTPFGDVKNPGHSPPERDSGGETRRFFVYPDPATTFADQRRDDQRQGRAAIAFIVDLESIDAEGGVVGAHHHITGESRLSEFLPRHCERSLQKRLSWMKRMHQRRHSTTSHSVKVSEGNENTAAQERQRFKSTDSRLFGDSFDDAIASDAIADDVSDAGTYTIDASSDSESMGSSFDARGARILAEFGVSEFTDAEPSVVGQWCSATQSAVEMEGKPTNFDSNSERFRNKLKELAQPSLMPLCSDAPEQNTSDDDDAENDPGTPTPKNSSTRVNVIENVKQSVGLDCTEQSYCSSVDQQKLASDSKQISKSIVSNEADVVLTIYTDAPSEHSVSHRRGEGRREMSESFRKNLKNSARSVRSLDTAVLLGEDDESLKSQLTCETQRSQTSVDTQILLQDPEVFSSSNSHQAKLRYNIAAKSSKINRCKIPLSQSSAVISDSRKGIMPSEKNYSQSPISSCLSSLASLDTNALMTNCLDYNAFELKILDQRQSTVVSESEDSLESCENASFQGSSPRTDISLDTQVLLGENKNRKSKNDESGTSFEVFSAGNSLELRSDFDGDGSSVDPLDDLISARTVASLTTEVLLKPTEEFICAVESTKVQKHRKPPDDRSKIAENNKEMKSANAFDEDSELSSCRSSTAEDQKSPISKSKLVKESSSVGSEKPTAVKHLKSKPPTPKSIPKASPPLNYHLSTRRCFSDLSVADHDETVSVSTSNAVQELKATGPKATVSNSIEHTRVNRTFALRCARREASDANETSRLESSNPQQRFNRAAKKNGSSKFDEVQRSRSASRSRASTISPRSPLESRRSTETYVSLGQKIVRKSQENDKKSQTSNTETSLYLHSLSRNDDSSSTTSHKSAPLYRASTTAPTKKKTKSDHGKVEASGGPQSLAIKGSTVHSVPQSLPISSSSLPDSSSNEWMRRKKYNPKQSLKAEISAKKAGKQDGQVINDGLDQRSKNWKRSSESSSLRSAPSTPSDWTDDEKLQLTPPGRDLPAVCQLSAKVKVLSDQVLQALRKRPEFRVNETLLQSSIQKASDLDSLNGSSPEFLYIYHNLQAAERQMSDIYQVLSSTN